MEYHLDKLINSSSDENEIKSVIRQYIHTFYNWTDKYEKTKLYEEISLCVGTLTASSLLSCKSIAHMLSTREVPSNITVHPQNLWVSFRKWGTQSVPG